MKKLMRYAVAFPLVGMLLAPAVSLAQSVPTLTVAQLQAEIQSLNNQLATLHAQLMVAQGGSTSTGSGGSGNSGGSGGWGGGNNSSSASSTMGRGDAMRWCHSFAQNLKVGDTGSEVTALQTALLNDGETITVTGTFDAQTLAALKAFQQKYSSDILTPNGLTKGTGFAGTSTRSKLNLLFRCINFGPGPVHLPGSTSTTSTPPMACPAWGCNGPEQPISPLLNSDGPAGAATFTATPMQVVSGKSITFSWTNATAPTGTTNFFGTTGCVSGITMFDVTNNQNFLCGDVDRSVAVKGSDVIQFTSVNRTGTQVPFVLDYGNGKSLNRTIGVAPATNTTSTATTLSVTMDSSEPPASNVLMGSTANTVAVLRFTETSNIQNVNITDLTLTDTVSATASVKSTFSNVTVWNGSTLLGTAGVATVKSSNAYAYTFHFSNPIVIPQANSLSLTFKADVSPFSSGAATDGASHTFSVAAGTDVKALGATTNTAVPVTATSAQGNPLTVLRSTITVTGAALGGSSHSKSSADSLGTLSATANAAGSVAVNTVTVTFTGSAVSQGGSAFMNSVQLLDQNNNNVTIDGATSSVGTSAVTWSFPSGFIISAGTTYSFTVRVNSSLIPPESGVSESLSANVANTTDILWSDAIDSSAIHNLSLPSTVVPVIINSVTYPVGQ